VLDPRSAKLGRAGLRWRTTLGVLAFAGLVAGVATGVSVAQSDLLVQPIATGFSRGLTVVLGVWVGCYMWARSPHLRFAALIVASAFLLGLGGMVASADPDVFALGRLVTAVLWVLVFYLFLSFPTGRITEAGARWAMTAMAVATVLLWLPILLFARRLPLGGTLVDCRHACPPNGLMVFPDAGGLGDAFSKAAELSTIPILLVGAILLAKRLRVGSSLVRRALAPPLLAMSAILAVTAVRIALSDAHANVGLQEAAAWAGRVAIVAFPFSFLLGMFMGRLLSGEASRNLLDLVRERASSASIRDALALALDDSSLSVAVWLSDSRGYVDARGSGIEIPDEGSGRSIWRIDEDGEPQAVIIHDPGLDDVPGLADAAVAAYRLSLENARTEARLWASIHDLRQSRERVVRGADAERRRIERELHDGTQQRLAALQVKLAVLFHQAGPDKAVLRQLEAEAESALDELRGVVHRIYPPVLADRGLIEALKAMSLMAAVPTRVDAQDVGRMAPHIESTIYLCCNEAVQNAAKHGGPEATVLIRLRRRGGLLTFEARDAGAGFDPNVTVSGTGLSTMRDRVRATGGELEIHSAPGGGTTIVGTFPCAENHRP
jgi:signal transduction histidine kinase